MAGEADVLLAHRQRLALRDANLFAHQVKAGDHLRHGMFDLKPGVHLDEVEFAIFPQELDRARAAIAHVGHRLRAGAADAFALGRRQDGRGRFLQHLLVAALERAVALAQVDGVAIAVAEHLDFDVARIAEIFFDIDGGIAKRSLRLAACLLHQRFELIG